MSARPHDLAPVAFLSRAVVEGPQEDPDYQEALLTAALDDEEIWTTAAAASTRSSSYTRSARSTQTARFASDGTLVPLEGAGQHSGFTTR